ncbi:MAG: hypothetical protein JST26_13395 [Bacteroidetes bacterium]|nr:hypothetical protein [Bacteroidota bacterium]
MLTKDAYNSKLTIQQSIAKLTGLNPDTAKFEVLADSIHYTEGAFDLDYTWHVHIRFQDQYFDKIKRDIRNTPVFDSVTNDYDKNWSLVDTSKVKGLWHSDSASFMFTQKPKKFNPERIYLWVDTPTKTLTLQLVHI